MAGLPQGTFLYYRIRAYGNGQDTAYTPKARTATYLPAPTWDDESTFEMMGESASVQFIDNSTNETGFTVTALNEDGDTIQTVTLGAHEGTGPVTADFDGLSASTDYYFTVGATLPIGTHTIAQPIGPINTKSKMPTTDVTTFFSNPVSTAIVDQ